MNASSNDVWPSLSKSAEPSLIALARYFPNRVAFASCPLRVAVTITRFDAESTGRNGPLLDAQLITASGRLHDARAVFRSSADKSGPRKLNFAERPSNVPWP